MAMKAVIMVDGGYFDALNYYLKDKRGKKLSLEKLSLKCCEGKEHIITKLTKRNIRTYISMFCKQCMFYSFSNTTTNSYIMGL